MIRIAVVGCGAISRSSHIPALLHNELYSLTALVDKDTTTLEHICRQFHISPSIHTRIEQLKDVDAAVVAVPPQHHAEVSINLLSRGLHLLCEKPLATNIPDANAMIRAAHQAHRLLAVGFMRRFSPNTILLKDALQEQCIGSVHAIKLWDGIHSEWNAASPHRYDPHVVPGGVLYEGAIHWIDRLIHLFGMPRILEYKDDKQAGVEVNAYIRMHFDVRGCPSEAELHLSWTDAFDNRLEVTGEKGTLILRDSKPSDLLLFTRLGESQRALWMKSDIHIDPLYLFDQQLIAFASAINGRHTPLATGEDGLSALSVVLNAYNMREDLALPWVHTGLLAPLV